MEVGSGPWGPWPRGGVLGGGVESPHNNNNDNDMYRKISFITPFMYNTTP